MRTAIRSNFLFCTGDPGLSGAAAASTLEFVPDGLLLMEAGVIAALQPAATLLPQLGSDIPIADFSDHLVVPGFVDTHVHFPQVDVIASYGTQLLEWLQQYTFPEEQKFHQHEHAAQSARFFLDQLLGNGTTTASVFCTVHPQSVDAFFTEAQKRRLEMIAGKCLMDRNAPAGLRDTADSGYHDSKALIERWHKQGRLHYSITPRFAPTSTPEQLLKAGQLGREHPDVYIQSHVAENRAEVAWVADLFPQQRSYLEVYDHFGLLRDRAIYAHCIYLDELDRERLRDSGTSASFCPTSNLFMGSGLYDLMAAAFSGHRVGIGSDVGGGTDYSLLRTLGEAYKVQQLLGHSLHPSYALYLATLGGAKALYLDDHLGKLQPGYAADLVVLNPAATPLLARRTKRAHAATESMGTAPLFHPLDTFFALMMLGDDRAVAATYIGGQRWQKELP